MIDAGAGDDHVQITKDPALSSRWDPTSIDITLGEGADTLDLTFFRGTSERVEELSRISAEIRDFDPDEDILTINIAERDPNFVGYEVVERDGNSEVVLTYRGIGPDWQPLEYTSVVRLEGVTDLPASSLRVIAVPPDPAG